MLTKIDKVCYNKLYEIVYNLSIISNIIIE